MANIYPFRAIRYAPEKVGDLSTVVTQPYDRIGPEEQRRYQERSPYNIVRIIGGKLPPEDDSDYARRGELFRRWLGEGVLVQDAEPALYAYHQEFSWEGRAHTRKGLVALLDLRGEGVKAHEDTLRGPKEDRLKLLRATEANFGHVFMLYDDPGRTASELVHARAAESTPDAEARDDFGNRHLLWRVADPQVVHEVQRALADLPVYIADGHHRFETARTFMAECLAKGWQPRGPESFTSRMVTLVNVAEPGCVIRPTPRVVHSLSGFVPDEFLRRAEQDFEVEALSSLQEAKRRLAEGLGIEHVFVAYTGGKFWALSLPDDAPLERLVPGRRSPQWKRLDVAILHKAVLERMLGIDEEKLSQQTNVHYAEHAEAAVRAVDQGRGQVAFLLNPTQVEEVMAVAAQGERMPQKSTDFYPKLLTGLVAVKMDIDRG
ncbi:MAG: DUF1015 domain-containing protein [Candidatus Bipolaricaulaceae bacterium]